MEQAESLPNEEILHPTGTQWSQTDLTVQQIEQTERELNRLLVENLNVKSELGESKLELAMERCGSGGIFHEQ